MESGPHVCSPSDPTNHKSWSRQGRPERAAPVATNSFHLSFHLIPIVEQGAPVVPRRGAGDRGAAAPAPSVPGQAIQTIFRESSHRSDPGLICPRQAVGERRVVPD